MLGGAVHGLLSEMGMDRRPLGANFFARADRLRPARLDRMNQDRKDIALFRSFNGDRTALRIVPWAVITTTATRRSEPA